MPQLAQLSTKETRIEVAGEDALIIYLDNFVDNNTSNKIAQLENRLAEELSDCLVDLIPSYVSLLVIFNPLVSDYYAVKQSIIKHLTCDFTEARTNNNIIELPVYYSPESGPDLKNIAKTSKLSVDEVIKIHQEKTYQVFAIGFAPGFAFLGEVDARIATPRLDTPRAKVPRGAVAIADQQTAIYPEQSPGGWNLIGLCPLPLFEPNAKPHLPYQVGDKVRFTAISKIQFLELGGQL